MTGWILQLAHSQWGKCEVRTKLWKRNFHVSKNMSFACINERENKQTRLGICCMRWNFMAVHAVEISKKLLIKVRFIAFMLMKDGKRFSNLLLETLHEKKAVFRSRLVLFITYQLFALFVCIHTTNKLFWISGFKYVHQRK